MQGRKGSQIGRTIEYLRSNDERGAHDGLEGELADALAAERERIERTLRKARSALLQSAEFAGTVCGGDDEVQEPWNVGGYGYEASREVDALLRSEPEPVFVGHYRDEDGMARVLCERHARDFGEMLEPLEPFEKMVCEECARPSTEV